MLLASSNSALRGTHLLLSVSLSMSLIGAVTAKTTGSAEGKAEAPSAQAGKEVSETTSAEQAQPNPVDPLASAPGSELAPPIAVEPPETIYLKPREARFQVISVHLSTPLDGRRLSPKRLITLAVKGEGHIMESFWQRKRLSLYREVIIPSPVAGVPAGVRHEPVGFARVESVMGDVLQAYVEVDGLTQRTADPTDAMVVMIGDSGKLFVEPEVKPKPKVRRAPKPKEKSPFVREEMKWRL